MAYVESKAQILESRVDGNVSTVVARFDRVPSRPIAPAALYVDPKSGNEQFQLHRLFAVSDNTLTFETFNSTHSLPPVGDTYSFRSWWVKRAMDAALDTATTWRREQYPDDGTHQHCLFTWAAIEAKSENPVAYHSKYGWVTVRAYENFIRDDIYRIRESCDA